MISSEMSTVTFLPSRSVMNSNGWPLLTVPRIVPPRWAMPRTLSRVRSTRPSSGRLQQPVVAAADAGDLPAAPQPGERDGANDCVQAGSVAPAGVDQDVHALKAISWLHAERKRGVWKQSTPSPKSPGVTQQVTIEPGGSFPGRAESVRLGRPRPERRWCSSPASSAAAATADERVPSRCWRVRC